MALVSEAWYDTGGEATRTLDVCIVGGAGHVGLPLGLVLANEGLKVCLYDVNSSNLQSIARGKMPFLEHNAEPILQTVLGETLLLSSDPRAVSAAEYVIVAVGTPVDEYLNPRLSVLLAALAELRACLRVDQTIVIRSTVYPGTCRRISQELSGRGGTWHVAYCPERIAQGHAIRELQELPQLVSGLTEHALRSAGWLFSTIAPKVIKVSVEEAELAKLFANAWRYVQFAAANQFYMTCRQFDVDFARVHRAMVEEYPRAANLPGAGFAAGPCLLKDTMQLAAFNNNAFSLGHAAMMINEGLPGFIVEQLRRKLDLNGMRVGILGMAFKADSDDIRDSLAFKLAKVLRFHGATVVCSDEYVQDASFVPKEVLVETCPIVIVGAPHSAYEDLRIPRETHLEDLWGIIQIRE